jgi:hypothetical protein
VIGRTEGRAAVVAIFGFQEPKLNLPLPGLEPSPAVLIDERHRPDFRDVFGAHAGRATIIATAVTRVRLSTVDLTADELSKVECFRVLIAEVNALSLESEARGLRGDGRRAPNVETLHDMLEAGRLEIRSAPLGGWSPDFTVFEDGGGPSSVLVGFHWFERPYPHRGPALATLHFGEAARLAARRHAELWKQAHDVGPAIRVILSRARSGALGASVP